MGWLWNDKGSRDESSPPASKEDSRASQIPPPQSSANLSQQEQRDQTPQAEPSELERFLAEFQTPTRQSRAQPPPSSSSPPSRSSPSPATLQARSQIYEEIPDDAPDHSNSSSKEWTPSILHPTSMSCSSAFDQAFHCQNFAGQFLSYYRTGQLRDCRELWGNFWFCMRTNRGFMSDGERQRRIQTFYMARDAQRAKEGGSSEDVWEARKEEELHEYARQMFRWDLRKWEKGEAVLREDA